MNILKSFKLITVSLSLLLGQIQLSVAQIIPDQTLPSNSQVGFQNNVYLIENGTISGNNLFHSFEQFSLSTGEKAWFNNSLNIDNIFSRVTGNLPSRIDGLVQANGIANLFILNSQGIIFGKNARLDIGGSFLATTANSISFENGFEFLTQDNSTLTLLTFTKPIGLHLTKSADITIQGGGNNYSLIGFLPTLRNNSDNSLAVKDNKNLALIAQDINLEGGFISASGGFIDLISVKKGNLDFNLDEWNFILNSSSQLADINLNNNSLIDASAIKLQGNNINLTNNSLVLIQNQGTLDDRSLTINADNSLNIIGGSFPNNIPSNIRTETIGSGKSADIQITAKNLTVENRGQISTQTFGQANSGNIDIKVEKLKISNSSVLNSNIITLISSSTFGLGNAGNINISAKDLIISNGGSISSGTFAFGDAGNISINSSSILISGIEKNFNLPSNISTTSYAFGDGGKLLINTSELIVTNGGRIDSSTFVAGNGGDITINADNFIKLQGYQNIFTPSQIISSAGILNESLKNLISNLGPIPDKPNGLSGNITINTPKIQVFDLAKISVNNDGINSAGEITINSQKIELSNQGEILATTFSEKGGNIFLNSNLIMLNQNSKISTSVLNNFGNGGNIEINADTLTVFDESNIVANAFQGNGGNINITAEGLFLSEDSFISASSEFGLDGAIEIETNTDTNNLFNQTEINFTPETPLIAYSCFDGKQRPSQFESGLNNPRISISAPKPLLNTEEINTHNSSISPNKWQLGQPIIEGTVLEKTSNGWRLVAANNNDIDVGICY